MIYNDFFKNESTITNHSKKRLDWLELKKNPWNIFSNYEKKFDNSLEKIHHLKNEYVNHPALKDEASWVYLTTKSSLLLS